MKTMKSYKKSILVASSCLLFSLHATAAYCASVSASAQMDWNTLTAAGTAHFSLINDLGWRSPYGLSNAGTIDEYMDIGSPIYLNNNSYDYKYNASYTSIYTSAKSSIGPAGGESAVGSGQTNNNSALTIKTTGSVEAGNGEAFSAEGKAQRGQAFLVTDTGSITFSINYSLNPMLIDATGNWAYNESWVSEDAWAYVRAWNQLRKLVQVNGVWQWQKSPEIIDIEYQHSDVITDGMYSYSGRTGLLSITYFANAGDYILYEAGLDTQVAARNNAVPIPGAVWLLGSGIIGLVAARKKTQLS